MIGSVSSKYLDYRSHTVYPSPRDHQLNDRSEFEGKLSNLNEYAHIYSNGQTNEANFHWILSLRGSKEGMNKVDHDQTIQSGIQQGSIMSKEESGEKAATRRYTEKIGSNGTSVNVGSRYLSNNPPGVYFKGNQDNIQKKIPDFDYKGNNLEVSTKLN